MGAKAKELEIHVAHRQRRGQNLEGEMKWLTYEQANRIPEGSVVVTRMKWEGRINRYYYTCESYFMKERDLRHRQKGYDFLILERPRKRK